MAVGKEIGGDMESSLIRVVHTGGMLIIGVQSVGRLESPRVLELVQAPGGQIGIRFLELIGKPKAIDLGDFAFSYECQDEALVTAYREHVTGLSLVTKVPGNLIQMGATRQ